MTEIEKWRGTYHDSDGEVTISDHTTEVVATVPARYPPEADSLILQTMLEETRTAIDNENYNRAIDIMLSKLFLGYELKVIE